MIAILDRTYGFGNPTGVISTNRLVSLTGLSDRMVWKTIRILKELRMICYQPSKVKSKSGSPCNEFMFNKHYDTWLKKGEQTEFKRVSKRSPIQGLKSNKESLNSCSPIGNISQLKQQDTTAPTSISLNSCSPPLSSTIAQCPEIVCDKMPDVQCLQVVSNQSLNDRAPLDGGNGKGEQTDSLKGEQTVSESLNSCSDIKESIKKEEHKEIKKIYKRKNELEILNGIFKGKEIKIIGLSLEWFHKFWDAFNYKKGKVKAVGAWSNKVGASSEKFNIEIAQKICDRATITASNRPGLVAKGRTPKMAEGWINDERYEDEYDIQSINGFGLNQTTIENINNTKDYDFERKEYHAESADV